MFSRYNGKLHSNSSAARFGRRLPMPSPLIAHCLGCMKNRDAIRGIYRDLRDVNRLIDLGIQVQRETIENVKALTRVVEQRP